MQFGKRRTPRTINLALQGGGAHGAFTWGVLDALLEDGRLGFEGISGTSAGAMNALAMAHGLMVGGPDGARAALQKFWTAVAGAAPLELTQTSADGTQTGLSPLVKLMLQWTHYLSPEQINPFDLNPLRDIVTAQIDFARLRTHSPVKLFVATTQANTGKLRLFRNAEMSADVLLASACLPTLHRAIEIDGEPYWDGGFAANPAIFPLFFECHAPDLLLVLLSPLKHAQTPLSATDIQTRVLEIAFNSTFLREMRMFAHLRQQVRPSWFVTLGRLERRVQRAHFHLIEDEEVLRALSPDSKLAANLRFFEHLKGLGRRRAQAWLGTHHGALGKRSSVDLSALFY
ncbi:MAG: patatin-like phospholipase family protein [Burkholderiaceae bacterium]|nr:patatin-like phospholipase family protein [Burkholderiaceae bacterium]